MGIEITDAPVIIFPVDSDLGPHLCVFDAQGRAAAVTVIVDDERWHVPAEVVGPTTIVTVGDWQAEGACKPSRAAAVAAAANPDYWERAGDHRITWSVNF